jgi:hypothetical protein
VWDGLPAHRSQAMRRWLANLAADALDDIVAAAERGIQRIRATHGLAQSFLRHCGLSLW